MKTKALLTLACLFCCFGLSAQQQELTPEQQEKKMRESIEKYIEDLERALDLDPGQVFYLDSIMFHNYEEMTNEMNVLNSNKVENADLYIRVRDKWDEKSYQAIRKILNDEQWGKYLKRGAGRAKKARDKREAKRNEQ